MGLLFGQGIRTQMENIYMELFDCPMKKQTKRRFEAEVKAVIFQ